MQLVHELGVCGITFVLLVWHMFREEHLRRQVKDALKERQRKEDE